MYKPKMPPEPRAAAAGGRRSGGAVSRSRRRKGLSPLRIALGAAVLIMALALFLYLSSNYNCYGGEIYPADTVRLELRGQREPDIEKLCDFKELRYLDLRDSGITVKQAEKLTRALPDCELVWSVPIAGQTADSDSTELDFSKASAEDFSLLGYFPRLASVNAVGCGEYDLLLEYSETMPHCRFVWSVPVCGEEYRSTATQIALPEADAAELKKLRWLPALEEIDLSGCTDYAAIRALAEERPECRVTWSVELCGKSISSEAQEADISGKKITDLAELEERLKSLPNLKKLIMCDCGLKYTELDELDKKYPDLRIVWRVYFGRWSVRTDATVFSTQNYDPPSYRLVDSEVSVLKYCRDLQMLDLGHNSITSVAPFTELTELRVLILADNRISDIFTLEKLTKLEYFEMFINRISDISVVRNMPNLTHVNFCWNQVADATPLYELEHLERVWMCGWRLNAAAKRELRAALPGCEFDLDSGYGSTNGSWRYNKTFDHIRDGFRNHNGACDYYW